MRTARLFLPLALVGFAAAPAPAAPVLAPHRAVYDLDLSKARDDASISGLSGRMVYEFNGSPCEGYSVTFRFVTQIHSAETSQVTDQQTTTFEGGEGKTFSFSTRSFIDQDLQKEVKGRAELDGGALRVVLEKPEPRREVLEASQFPTQHLIELLEMARKGRTVYETTLFDGSEDADRIMMTTVIIGKEKPARAGDPERGALKELATLPYWPVSIAYFDPAEERGEEVPSYQISFKLHDNGVTRDLVMDYGDFSMTGRLVDLAILEAAEECPAR